MLSRSIYATLCVFLMATGISPPADCQAQGRILSFEDTEVSQALVQIGDYFGLEILTDGNLEKKVTATLRDPEIAQALTSVTGPFGYKWRKITLAVKPEDEVSGARLRSIVSALERLDAAGALVENPVEATRLSFRKNPDEPQDPAGQSLPTGEVYRTYYFVYTSKPKITFAPGAPTTTAPSTPGTAQGPSGPISNQGLMDWFSGLDREAQSQLVGELIGSMMGSGEGEVSFMFDTGDAEGGAVRQGRIVIRKDESGQGEGQ